MGSRDGPGAARRELGPAVVAPDGMHRSRAVRGSEPVSQGQTRPVHPRPPFPRSPTISLPGQGRMTHVTGQKGPGRPPRIGARITHNTPSNCHRFRAAPCGAGRPKPPVTGARVPAAADPAPFHGKRPRQISPVRPGRTRVHNSWRLGPNDRAATSWCSQRTEDLPRRVPRARATTHSWRAPDRSAERLILTCS